MTRVLFFDRFKRVVIQLNVFKTNQNDAKIEALRIGD